MIKRVVITVKYNIMSYLIGEGFRNVFKNKKSTSAALSIMCMAMFMFGIFFMLGENINYVMSQVQSEQGFKVWVELDATDEETQKIGDAIRKIQGTNTVEYISKSQGWNEFKEDIKDYSYIAEGFGSDYFQDSFAVTLTDLELNSKVQEEILKIEKVDEITSSDDAISILVNIAKGIRMATFVILLILVFISIFIITNTIKLTVHARRKEISIMKYVGATNGFIRWPFIVEGMIIGMFASIISIILIGLAYSLIARQLVNSPFMQTINMSLIGFSDMFSSIIFVYMLLGIGIGALRKCYFYEKIFKSIKEKRCVNLYLPF